MRCSTKGHTQTGAGGQQTLVTSPQHRGWCQTNSSQQVCIDVTYANTKKLFFFNQVQHFGIGGYPNGTTLSIIFL